METRIFISDHKPAKFTARMIGETCWLEIEHDGNTVALVMPGRMDAAARMIAEAFNAHMMGGPITKLAQALPTGGALSAEGALAVALAQGASLDLPKVFTRGTERMGHAPRMTIYGGMLRIDDEAAHAVERRDLP